MDHVSATDDASDDMRLRRVFLEIFFLFLRQFILVSDDKLLEPVGGGAVERR